jgi:RNA polymerase sigma factor (sigma-70 family)
MTHSPLAAPPTDPSDEQLVARAQGGDRRALEQLVGRHGPWIFNVAARMVWLRDDAADVTQEVLVKVITRLSTFRGESAFRTWLYRIVVNHVINLKKRQPLESAPRPFESFAQDLDEAGDAPTPDEPGGVPAALLVEEAKIGCTLAMLMCLDRRQRVVFILGEILGVTDRVGAEVTELSPENFRQVLVRARRDLYSFMHDKCGLVNKTNPCRCARKTRGFIDKGYVDPRQLQFVPERLVQIRTVAPSRVLELDALEQKHAELYREHPMLPAPDEVLSLQRLFEHPTARAALAADFLLPTVTVVLQPGPRKHGGTNE